MVAGSVALPVGGTYATLKLRVASLVQLQAQLAQWCEFRILRTQATFHGTVASTEAGLMAGMLSPIERPDATHITHLMANGAHVAPVSTRQYRTNVLGAEQEWRLVTRDASVGNLMAGVNGVSTTFSRMPWLIEVTHTIQVRGFRINPETIGMALQSTESSTPPR